MKIKGWFLLCLFALPAVTNADCPRIRGNVVIFGGRGATTAEMQMCYPDFLSLSNVEGKQFIACLAQQIDASSPVAEGQRFVIVGHSSGAAQAERLVHKVKEKSKVRLVLLEGFGSPANQRGVDTTCWYAENGEIEGMNASYMQNPANCLGQVKSYSAPWCKNSLCLHLSLVNRNVRADLDRSNVFVEGLKSCSGNLEWLNQ